MDKATIIVNELEHMLRKVFNEKKMFAKLAMLS